MKKTLLLFLASCLIFSMVTCTKKAKEQPIIVFNNGDTIVSVDEGVKQEVLVNINAPGQLEEVSFFYTSTFDTLKTPIGESVVNFPKPKRYSSKVLVEGKSEDYFFVVKARDKNNKIVFSNLLVQTSSQISQSHPETEIKKEVESKPVVTVTKFSDLHQPTLTNSIPSIPSNKKGQFVVGFNNNSVGSSLSIANLNNESAVQKLSEAQENQSQIDLMFFYGKENQVTLTSPAHALAKEVFNHNQYGIQNWTTKSITYLTKLKSNLTFERVTLQDVENTFDSDNGENIALNHLTEGDIVFFQTENGTLGAIHITYIGESSRSVISFDVKILIQDDNAQVTATDVVIEEEIIDPLDDSTTVDVYDDILEDEIIEEGEEEFIEEEEIVEEEEDQVEVPGGTSFQDASSLKFNEISFHVEPHIIPYSLDLYHFLG